MQSFITANPIEKGPFEATWESLGKFECPDWFRDAKFGIWSHWGPQSVPMAGDWYARHMYVQDHPQYNHHLRTYGHPSKHGWKDVVQSWKAERFDPDGLMKQYIEAGAKYFVAQAAHHDNFDNFNSKHHRWNSVNMGPKKDIVKLWRDAAKKYNLPFGLTEHLGATYTWWITNKLLDQHGAFENTQYDGFDTSCEDLYLPHTKNEIEEGRQLQKEGKRLPWYTDNPYWHEKWYLRVKDMIDQYEPELLYSDGELPFGDVGLAAVAHLYNMSAKKNGKNIAVYNQKNKDPKFANTGVFDIERGQMEEAAPTPWQTDTCVAGWFYDIRAAYKTPKQIVETLVDIVSKNGNLLLNFTQRPDGTLDEECNYILKSIAKWNAVNTEGIHGSRPWKIAAEGPAKFVQKARFEEKAVEWTTADFRFTAKGSTVYAFQMKYPDNRETYIRSLGKNAGTVKKVSLLGFGGAVRFRQNEDCLFVELPAEKACDYAPCIKVEF
ncbi:MAG: alpha-L-fucosidase [Spirochaetes bacterium]|nr:alpha-L-fucosidase [Spirochaetota bacterium]